MEKYGKKRNLRIFHFVKNLKKKTQNALFSKSENFEAKNKNQVFFLKGKILRKKTQNTFSANAEKNTTLKGKYFPRTKRVGHGVGKDGLKAQPARSLPLPVTYADEKEA